MIRLSNFEKQLTDTGVKTTCDVEIDEAVASIHFDIQIDADLAKDIQPNPMSFLIGMLIPAMERGEDIFVDAPLDRAFLHRLNKYAISALQCKDTSLKVIAVSCNEVAPGRPISKTPRRAMTGMSCGVDSLRTLMVYGPEGPDIPERYRLGYLSVFDVGAFYDSDQQYPLALEKAKTVAAKSDCHAIGVSANFRQFYKTSFPNSCTLRHVACAYSLTDMVSVYLVSSAYPWWQISLDPFMPTAMEGVDPVVLPMISDNNLEIFSACADEQRRHKVRDLIESSPYLDKLDICTRPTDKRDFQQNCGTCQKCGDFIIQAEYMGELDKVRPYFDMEAFERRKFRVFQRKVTSKVIYKHLFPNHPSVYSGERHVPSPFGAIQTGALIGKLFILLDWLKIKRL